MAAPPSPARTVRFGLMFLQAAPFGDVVERVRRGEQMGFDSLWVADHMTGQYPKLVSFEAWSLLGALAMATSRARLGTLVTPITFRHPAVLAMAAATVSDPEAELEAATRCFVVYSGSGLFKLRKGPAAASRDLSPDPRDDLATRHNDMPVWPGTAIGIDVAIDAHATFKQLLDDIYSAYRLEVRSAKKDKFKRARFS
jgi:hypothetical protein